MHHHTKFCKDRSNCCTDIAIFVIFKMAASAILDFQKFEIFMDDLLKELRHHAKFHEIGHTVADMAILRFSKWPPSAILDCEIQIF